jgi:hypothetical protein
MITPPLLAMVSGIFTSFTKIIDDMHISADERAAAQAEIMWLHNQVLMLALQLEQQQLAASARLIAVEADGRSWLQRNWRPIAMLRFLALVIADSCGLLASRLSDAAWTLLQIGLGGYVVGRSIEKIAPKMTGFADHDPRPRRCLNFQKWQLRSSSITRAAAPFPIMTAFVKLALALAATLPIAACLMMKYRCCF